MDTKVEVVFPTQQYALLASLAKDQKVPIAQLALVAVQEWLDRWTRIQTARRLLREFSEVTDHPIQVSPGDVASRHDDYLYSSLTGSAE
jgi:hypothetical protein